MTVLIGSKLPLKVTLNDQIYWLDWLDNQYILKSFTSETDEVSETETTEVSETETDEVSETETTESVIKKFDYQLPDFLSDHILNWFTESKLPNPKISNFYQCFIDSPFIPDNSLTLLVGYTEKYRKYLYPMIFNLNDSETESESDRSNGSYYLTSQPIYYNYNQYPSLELEDKFQILKIRQKNYHDSNNSNDFNEDSYNLIRIFTLNPPIELYQIITYG